jgi:cytochrome c-type biogenesis protein
MMLALLVFVAGVLTFLAPCTLPVLPAYLAYSAQPGTTSRLLRTIFFGLGVSICFVLFGVLAGTLGSLVALNKPLLARISGLLLIMLGVSVLAGVGIPGFSIQSNPSRTLGGSFLFGIIFALSWSGCIGPVLGFVLVLAANSQTAAGGALLLLLYSAGLLLPLLVVSALIDRLPKKGRAWTLLRGKVLTIGSWKVHSTELITGLMLITLGIVFALRLDAYLGASPVIEWIYALEERLAAALGITLNS